MFFFDFFGYEDITLLKLIFKDDTFSLPIRWNGKDFYKTASDKLNYYVKKVSNFCKENEFDNIKDITNLILSALKNYLNGSPSFAYKKIDELVNKYLDKFTILNHDFGEYYRLLKVDKNIIYNRERIFHPPYNIRNQISTNRYSIAGYPCLYLSDEYNLCFKEINYNPYDNYYIASKFRIKNDDISVSILDLSIKPQNLYEYYKSNSQDTIFTYKNYLYVYPLIMVCSFIRSDKMAPFAPEYIIPQLLLECLRNRITIEDYNNVVGIKYFSCSQFWKNNTGNNLVFPTYKKKEDKEYCEILNKIFELTKPIIVNDYETIEKSKEELDRLVDYRHVGKR